MKIIWSLMAVAALYGADTRPVIVCFGDSLTAGFGLDSGQSYPSLLQRELDRRGYKYRVENLGVSGDTTQDGLARVANALALHPAIAVIELGANDGLRGQPVSGIERNLGQVVESFQKAKVSVLLAGITLPPNYGPEYIHRFAAIYPEVAAKYKVRLLDFLLAGVAGNPRLMQQDGLHPNAEGTRIVTATVLKALSPMLK
ncbi:MAG: arylesterase [Bryobacteraceae bacterium]|jgi:acyl-CoA thioesterase-1